MCTIYEFLCCYICKMTFVLTNSQTIPRKFLAKSSCPVLILCQGLWKQLHSIDDHIPELENAIYKGRKKKKKVSYNYTSNVMDKDQSLPLASLSLE